MPPQGGRTVTNPWAPVPLDVAVGSPVPPSENRVVWRVVLAGGKVEPIAVVLDPKARLGGPNQWQAQWRGAWSRGETIHKAISVLCPMGEVSEVLPPGMPSRTELIQLVMNACATAARDTLLSHGMESMGETVAQAILAIDREKLVTP